MTEEGEEADAFTGGRKLTKRERFRERLLKKPDKSDKPKAKDVEREEALNDFLKSSSEGDTLPIFPSPSRKPVPRISVSTSPRWPDVPESTVNQESDHLAGDGEEILPYRPTRRRRRNGLKVTFAETAPLIIGEGGDESEAPTIWISGTKSSNSAHALRHHEPGRGNLGSGSSIANSSADPQNTASNFAQEHFNPRALARVPTGFSDTSFEQETVATPKRLKDAEFELTMAGGSSTPTAVQPDLGLSPASAAGRKRRMREEEARALTSGLRDPSPEPSLSERNNTPPQQTQENHPATPTTSYSQLRYSPNASSDHLLSPVKSPSPSRPSSSSSHESPRAQSSRKQPIQPEQGSNGTAPHTITTTKRKPLPKAPASESKEDALAEFRVHARRYYGLFVLAAEKSGAGLAAPLSRWIRAATWWFLTAETNFKILRRDRQEGASISQITTSRRLMQAMVDLAKTAWIIEDMVREYAQAEALNLSSPESVERLIQDNVFSRFSRILIFWQDLSKRFDSLVAAVRRNGFMTTSTENLPLSAGIDTSIWHESSVPDPRISDWLTSANPPWVKMDDTMTPAEPFDLADVMPLKSTTDTFRIRSMLCHISGGFQDGQRTRNIPCMLTIGRRRGSYALVLFIASQDHGINVVIETDPVRGDGIEWQQTSLSVFFNFADGFLFIIHLQQGDYLHMRESYDLALRALTATTRDASTNKNLGEQLIFRATSRTFERKSMQKILSFPYEGEQQDCEILLFEKYEVLKGTSTKLHRGLRLSVMLSPHAANLGILDVHMGGDRPILVHTAHEYSPPRVELSDPLGVLLVIQFPRNRDFNKFYELITSLDHSPNGDNSLERLPLRSFSIEKSSSEVSTFLSGANWNHVQVTTEKVRSHNLNHSSNMALSATINVGIFSKEVVLADRLIQGMCAFLSVLMILSS
jgi:hypothetical protein